MIKYQPKPIKGRSPTCATLVDAFMNQFDTKNVYDTGAPRKTDQSLRASGKYRKHITDVKKNDHEDSETSLPLLPQHFFHHTG